MTDSVVFFSGFSNFRKFRFVFLQIFGFSKICEKKITPFTVPESFFVFESILGSRDVPVTSKSLKPIKQDLVLGTKHLEFLSRASRQ